ncbi:helix-turn-helix domain-containing protein [Aliarcobacter butzleri]|uniref:helix-turn-helix transcriptional regulator n=1 Tax=Aliarcobacter butzleri TaxID=28197 RepID=UPI00125F511A|nr:helix-turn-helix transcriptional regulator [Aliarcobacter butzleri]
MILELEQEVLLLKRKILDLEEVVNNLAMVQKLKIPLSSLAKELGVSRQTLSYHVKSNYKPQEDFYIENNKILLNVNILNSIKEHYNAK